MIILKELWKHMSVDSIRYTGKILESSMTRQNMKFLVYGTANFPPWSYDFFLKSAGPMISHRKWSLQFSQNRWSHLCMKQYHDRCIAGCVFKCSNTMVVLCRALVLVNFFNSTLLTRKIFPRSYDSLFLEHGVSMFYVKHGAFVFYKESCRHMIIKCIYGHSYLLQLGNTIGFEDMRSGVKLYACVTYFTTIRLMIFAEMTIVLPLYFRFFCVLRRM